ncbi:MAG: porin family protein [Bacteroidota bacterium]
MRVFISCLLLAVLGLALQAQQFSGGFKAGLNFNRFEGPVEGVDGMDFESFNNSTGFHVGATFAYEFTDLVGLKMELIYSQKGGEISYEGPGYVFLYSDTDEQAFFADTRVIQSIVNSYLDFPLTAYYRLGPLELEGGANFGFLISSRGSGSARYETQVPDIGELAFTYDANFLGDRAGAGSIGRFADNTLPSGFLPPSLIGAYYNSDRDDSRYSRIDLGLVIGLSVYLNNGLYVAARYNHGLTDVTQPENDLRRSELGTNNSRLFNEDDEDFNRSLQFSVGFRF